MALKYPFSDLELSRRLETAEGRSCAEFVEARAKLFPESGARWVQVAGAYAMYDGIDSPITQTFGLGMFDSTSEEDLDRIEEFYSEVSAPVYHEVSPLAQSSLFDQFQRRGYHPFEFTSVMYQPIGAGHSNISKAAANVTTRMMRKGEEEKWAQLATRGWSEYTELADSMLELSRVSANRSGSLSFFAEVEGKAVATGAMMIHEGVALLAGASTIPEARRQGAQQALLCARLDAAAERGCDLVMMCALPGSTSQRNAERNGFRIAYTRLKWRAYR